MKVTIGASVVAGMLLLATPAGAQVRWVTQADADGRCDDRRGNRDDERHCELREATLPAPGRLDIEGGSNGGMEIVGSDRSDVRVRAYVWARARTEGRARELASEVEL